MNTYTIIENGKTVVKTTNLKPIDKYLRLEKGMNQTAEGDIQPVNYSLTWGSFNYTSGLRYVPDKLLCSVSPPSGGISNGTPGANEFTVGLFDTENEGIFSGKKTAMSSSIGVVHGDEFYLVNGGRYGPEIDKVTTIQKPTQANRLTSFAYEGHAARVDGLLTANGKKYIAMNQNSPFAQLREFNGLVTNTMNLVASGEGTFIAYRDVIYRMSADSTKYVSYSSGFLPTELNKVPGNVVPSKILNVNAGPLVSLCLYKQDFESLYRIGFSRVTNALTFQNYPASGFNVALGANNLRYIDVAQVNDKVFAIEFDVTAPDKGIRISQHSLLNLELQPSYHYIDTKLSLDSKLVSVGNRLYVISNPRNIDSASVEVFYTDNQGQSWSKIRVSNFNFKANEVLFTSVVKDATTTYIIGNTRPNYAGITKQILIRG